MPTSRTSPAPRPGARSTPAPPDGFPARSAVLSAARVDLACRALRRRDPVLAAVMRRAGPYRIPPRRDPYAGLVRAVLHQQLAGAAAAAIERRLHAAFGGAVPSPEALLAASEETLAGVGLSRQKRATLREIAGAFATGALSAERLRRLPDEGVVTAVTALRGLGEWSAHMLLMTVMRRADVLPVGDYGVRKAAMQVYGLRALPGRVELLALGERWRPWRSVASWYLWRALE